MIAILTGLGSQVICTELPLELNRPGINLNPLKKIYRQPTIKIQLAIVHYNEQNAFNKIN
jgi:hypothetical protein